MLARRVEPHFTDDALVPHQGALNNHVDEQIQQGFDIAAGQAAAARALLDQQHHLFKREFRTRRVHTGDRPRVTRVDVVDAAAMEARVVVPDYQLSLAIGKEGQNARLAARLTGWRIDIRPDTAETGASAEAASSS